MWEAGEKNEGEKKDAEGGNGHQEAWSVTHFQRFHNPLYGPKPQSGNTQLHRTLRKGCLSTTKAVARGQ